MKRQLLLIILFALYGVPPALGAGAPSAPLRRPADPPLGPRRQLATAPCHRPSFPADDYVERLQFAAGGASSGRFVPLGNLTIGGEEVDGVCLCTRDAADDT